jgi:hypothetical protein
VATPEVIERIKGVVRDTSVPSWFDRVPANVGDTAAGTLKAAEWRSLAEVYLPIALVSIWGEGSSHESEVVGQRLNRILDHAMLLLSAVHLACLQTTTKASREAYLNCIKQYVKDLPDIHPHFRLRPNYHMAIHIYEFLGLFGPVLSWWSFPFENIIGILQRLPNNHKIGERNLMTLITCSIVQVNLSQLFIDPF